ncbi:androgen-dependent TFPI-regulating protein-like isoform X1 [Pieris brassicae]|uniref:androgen-dependent TFPI-regulating protein-like isoform X1 n=1 Tax=Pieris brassicae TaxID=7116 RepID=UPI001E660BF9|nr:androgen-dependent TFPI-regulating protein-like isoform X1 [Pieris brassicae]
MEDFILFRENNIFYNVLCFLITENEKLFDRSDARLYWKTVFHIFSILHHCYIGLFANSLHLDQSLVPDIKCLYTYRLAYLTGWNFSFQTIFLGLSLLYDFLEWAGKHNGNLGTKIHYWRDVLFCGCVLPFTLFVSSMFWTVYAIDRELVFPKIYDDVIPWWFNHCVHTNILVVLALETLLQPRRKPTDEKVEVTIYWSVALMYAVVYYTIYFTTHRWLYQVFGVMTWWQVCLYQLWIWGSSFVFYKLQFPINRLIHGDESQEIPEANGETKTGEQVMSPKEQSGKLITDLKTPPFSTRSWSVKFKNIRNQFESSRL